MRPGQLRSQSARRQALLAHLAFGVGSNRYAVVEHRAKHYVAHDLFDHARYLEGAFIGYCCFFGTQNGNALTK